MKLTKERKVYLALLGAGGFALVADRLMPGPESASAAPAAADVAVPHETPAGAELPAAPATKLGVLAARIAAVPAPKLSDRDLFHPPASWPTPGIGGEIDGPPLPDFDEFLRDHKVSSVMILESKPGSAAVMVNSKIYRIGDNVDGFTLMRADSETVEFRSPGGETRETPVAQGSRHNPAKAPAAPSTPAPAR